MLKIQNLRRHKLEPVDLTAETGHCVAVTGPSGSGKTLFLRAVADLDPAAREWFRQVPTVETLTDSWRDLVDDDSLDDIVERVDDRSAKRQKRPATRSRGTAPERKPAWRPDECSL